MSKIAIITDTHFGARGDNIPLHASMAKFYERIFFPALDAHDVNTVLHGGDYTDRRKYVNFATARWVEDNYRKPLWDRHIQEIVLVGNHDCYYKHTTDTNSIEELTRFRDDLSVVKHPVEMMVDGVHMLLLPWICNDNRAASLRLIEISNAPVVLGHLELSGFQMYRGLPNAEGMDARLFDRFSLVMSGHFHHKSHKDPIQYLGAPYPMIWSDYHDPRGFHLLDTKTLQLDFIENPYTIFMRIVYDDAGKKFDYIEELVERITATESPYSEAYVKIVVKAKTQPYWFELLIDALYKVNALDVSIVDDIVVNDDDTESPTISEDLASLDTLTLITEYVDTLTLNCDKTALNAYLRSLYTEALTVDQSARLS